MKKYSKIILSLFLIIAIIFGIFSNLWRGKAIECIVSEDNISKKDEEILEIESKKSFEFFWNEANSNKESLGYGLIRDRAPGDSNIASIASVGFGLSALTIGAERKWVPYEEAEERALGTLNTLLNNVQNEKGFFYHFINMNTGKREWNSEASIIDTAILICGAINAGEYFGGQVKKSAEEIYKKVEWSWYRNPKTNQFYMGYAPEKGFSGAWDVAAEQFMMYFLGAASPTHPISGDMFYDFSRKQTAYGFYPPFIQCPTGSIFTYQFSYAWFDFRNKVDKKGVNWWENSILASKTSRQYSIDNSKYFKTFGPNSWGLTACDGPNGYSGGYGMSSTGNDGTIAPCGAAGSIVFTPKESIDALNYYYNEHKDLLGKYGFKDAYNIDVSPAWYDKDFIGIDKGITLLMIENYRTGFIWENFMKNKYIQKGMKKAGVDHIKTKGKPIVHSVIVDGIPPIVGQTLKARYNYYSLKGINEEGSTYKWLISSSKNGTYKEISGENSLTYKIKSEDIGKYIKFEVTPKSKSSMLNIFSRKGKPITSYPIGEIVEKDPRNFKKNKEKNKDEEVQESKSSNKIQVVDDFEDNKVCADWKDAGDGVYKISSVNGASGNTNKSLNVEYNKGDKEWAYFYTSLDKPKDFSKFTGLQLNVSGDVDFILKFENDLGEGIAEKKFICKEKGSFNEVQWNFMGEEQNLKNIKRILIFAAPGEKSKSGKFKIDEIKFLE